MAATEASDESRAPGNVVGHSSQRRRLLVVTRGRRKEIILPETGWINASKQLPHLQPVLSLI